jgi:hypothetical protein
MGLIAFALRVFHRLREQESAVQTPDQVAGCGNAAFQIPRNEGCLNDLSALVGQVSSGRQANLDNSIQVTGGRSQIKENYGSLNVLGQGQAGCAGDHNMGVAGVRAHDGSYNLFKWDHAKGRMVPFKLSNPKTKEI